MQLINIPKKFVYEIISKYKDNSKEYEEDYEFSGMLCCDCSECKKCMVQHRRKKILKNDLKNNP